jgi:hypothetical protein
VAGTTQQFSATGTYSDGTTQNLTSTVTWTSGTPAIASINSAGLASALSAGTSTITAALGGVSSGTSLTVAAPVVQISSTLQSLTTNASGQYIAVMTVTNLGNITASPALSSAVLGAAAAVTPLPTIPNVAPNQTLTVSLTFPASAGSPGGGAVLHTVGSYTAALPAGGSTTGSWGATLRVVLP